MTKSLSPLTVRLAQWAVGVVAVSACGSSSATEEASPTSSTSAALTPAVVPGWRVVGRLSPKERAVFGGPSLPETVELRGVREDGAARKYFVYEDTDPRPMSTVPVFVDVRVAEDGASVANDLPPTPWNEGQGFYFPGQADVMTTMRSTELAVFNGDMVRWPDPQTWLFRNQKLIDGFLGYTCSAHGQSAGIQTLCDGVTHTATLGVMWGKFGFDTLALDDGSLLVAMQPYPADNDRHVGFNRLTLSPSQSLVGHEVPPLKLAVNSPYFSPDSVTLTMPPTGTKAYAVLAGRTGSATTSTGAQRDQYGLVAARYDYTTDAMAKVAEYQADVVHAEMGARDPVSGKLAFVAEDTKIVDLPLPPGLTQYKQRGQYHIVLFDPATEQFRALDPLPRWQMQTSANPGYVFSTSDLTGRDPTTSKPENLLWSEGKLYVWWTELVLRPDLQSVVRELVVVTPE